jgi:hypothetical protein
LASENKLHTNKPRERKWGQTMGKNDSTNMRCERCREDWATADDPIVRDFILSWGDDNMKGKNCKQENK